jgi:hypothetical protein
MVARGRGDFTLSTLFGETLGGKDARVFGLRAVAPDGGFLLAEKSDIGAWYVGAGGGGAADTGGGCG